MKSGTWSGGIGNELPLPNTIDSLSILNRQPPATTHPNDNELFYLCFYNSVKSEQWVKKQYNKVKKSLFKTENGVITDISSAGGSLVNSPVYVDSGEFKFSDDTINGKNVKVLECVTDGTCYIPTSFFNQTQTEAAYGKWKFYFYRATSISSSLINFISSDFPYTNTNNNGYSLYQQTSGDTYILARVGNGAITGPGIIDTYTGIGVAIWTKIKIVRTNDNSFSVVLNDISAINGVESTYTNSKYFSLAFLTGDKIAWSSNDGTIAIEKTLLA